MNEKKLNLGCGEFKKKGYINVDCFSVSEPDVCHDLNCFPYPFADDSFNLIEADHLLEHLDEPFRVMSELYRIAADDCIISLRVPHFSRGFTHSQHQRGFDVSFPLYFQPDFPGGYQSTPLKLESMRLRWFAQPYLKKKVLSPLFYRIAFLSGKIIDFFANLSPFICSRLWCFWVGGFEEIEIVFRVEKKSTANT